MRGFFLGSGKTHYIKNCLDSDFHKTSKIFSINETFNKTEVVQRLIKLKNGVTTCDLALFLNINLIWPQVTEFVILNVFLIIFIDVG